MPPMRTCLRALMLAAVLLPGAQSAFAVARFIYVDGNISVRSADGATRAGRAGQPINQQETVFVGEGRAQLRFDDGGWVALQPRTVFEVRQYDAREDGLTVLSLIK